MKPQREVHDFQYEKYVQKLFQAFITFGDSYDAERFLKEILTESEFLMLKRRWHVACLLNEGLDIRETAKKANVSTQTVQSVKRALARSQVWIEYLPKKKISTSPPASGSISNPSIGSGQDSDPESKEEGARSDMTRKYIFG